MNNYDPALLVASFVVAVMAAYAALFFGARLHGASDETRWRWLAAGALLMGTGIWTMHFVGMRAMPSDVPLAFDGALTTISWLAAVLASGVALKMIGRDQLGAKLFAGAAVAMAASIVVMHYLGMYALRMSAPPEFHTGFLVLSMAIALGASAAALALCRILQKTEGQKALVLQFVAAIVMAVAICGMHYTGMMAMTFPEGAVPAAGNALRGEWMGIPLAMFCSVLLASALAVTTLDIKQQRKRAEAREQEQQRVAELAFIDSATGLPNRSGLEQNLLDILARQDARNHPFALIYLDIANFRELSARMGEESLVAVINEVTESLKEHLSEDALLARYAAGTFFILVPDNQDARHAFMYKRLRQLDKRIGTEAMPITWRAGQSAFPVTGNSTRKLIRAAMVPRDLAEIGRFTNMAADPELVLPGQQRYS
ncbi:MHYT domain-containing protein [Marinobacter sp.]|uniref:MHYT domain-containing protein n=1 Tax=Marinobacter sp. TaxID=50741 RepID=UPI0035C6E2F3